MTCPQTEREHFVAGVIVGALSMFFIFAILAGFHLA